MSIIRLARENDLPQIHQVFYQNEVRGIKSPPSPGNVPPTSRHILHTGSMYVAEQDGQILAFAGAITRSTTTFLTDLFVHPEAQSSGLGKMLLERAFPQDELIHCTMSSTDPRAQALYIRSGMQPKFPNFNLQWDGTPPENLPDSSIEVVEGDAADPALIQWDAEVSGRERWQDHVFWVKEQQAVPLWFLRNKTTIGYGYVRLNVETLWYPQVCKVGPIGVNSPEHATDCVLAAINWACKQAEVVSIDVPGPHTCLATLLDSGFRIIYVELFVSNETRPFFDAERYIPSGSSLL
ncbi:MAG: GNAT family N-acetyltransferase [Ktedonobacteraceae bacterium]|nr:GNAT family N-acetyltransferase [Ktedonobacteraceae bacterium]